MNLKRLIGYNLVVLLILLLISVIKISAVQPNTLTVTDKPCQLTPTAYCRPLNQTLLTFPEWFLVYSPEEYADLIQHDFPSNFPFFKHIWQYWNGYDQVVAWSAQLHTPNLGYQVMLMVIGGSTTAEYYLRGVYESTIGNLTAHVSGRVPEDDYAYQEARDYANFISIYPWYEFDFYKSLKDLWRTIPWQRHGLLRQIDRRYVLSSEYLVKWGYAELIKVLTHAAYGVASESTMIVVHPMPKALSNGLNDMKIIKAINGQYLVEIPRYAAFAVYASALAAQNVQFSEIAGNRSFIALSFLTTQQWHNDCPNCQVILSQNIYTAPGQKRFLITVPVAQLSTILNFLNNNGYTLEHIYDY